MVFEIPEPFLPFGRPSRRETPDSPPLSPRSHRMPGEMPANLGIPEEGRLEAGHVRFGGLTMGGSWSNPIVIDDEENSIGTLEEEDGIGRNRAMGKSRATRSKAKTSPSLEYTRSQGIKPPRRRPSVVEESCLMSALHAEMIARGLTRQRPMRQRLQ